MAVRIGSSSVVDSIVVCHPGSVTIEQVKAIKVGSSMIVIPLTLFVKCITQVPAAWACAEGTLRPPLGSVTYTEVDCD